MQIKTLLVGAAIAAAGASAQETPAKPPVVATTGLENGMLPATTNAQSQTCASVPFKDASKMTHPHTHEDPNMRGQFIDPRDISYQNINWDYPVHESLWSFKDNATDAPHPLGFRQAVFKDNTPICLHMGAKTAQHKLELMIDFMAGSKICVEDIRTAHMNPSVELIRSCDDKGKVNRCFSALDGKYKEVQTLDAKETNHADQPADFAVAIGCFGGGCRDDYSQQRMYYRVRQSEKAWTDDQGGAGEGLDYWCMTLASLNTNYGIFRSTADYQFTANDMNSVPQVYPSDMWNTVVRNNGEEFGSSSNTVYPSSSSAAGISAGIATIALAALSLMF